MAQRTSTLVTSAFPTVPTPPLVMTQLQKPPPQSERVGCAKTVTSYAVPLGTDVAKAKGGSYGARMVRFGSPGGGQDEPVGHGRLDEAANGAERSPRAAVRRGGARPAIEAGESGEQREAKPHVISPDPVDGDGMRAGGTPWPLASGVPPASKSRSQARRV